MARITIVPSDDTVIVDGEARQINMTGIDPTIHAVQWFGDDGEVEFNDGTPHRTIVNLAPYQVFITRWTDAAPPPPPPPLPKSAADLTNKEIEQLLVDKGVVTRPEIDAVKTGR